MRILFLDPFHGGSHAAVADGYAAHSRHDVAVLALGQTGGWRWRMRGAAVTLARQTRAWLAAHGPVDLIIATDMLDLATFGGLTRDITAHTPMALYFHENQLTYPLPAGRKPDLSWPWINYTSALVADAACFNSQFHRRAFLEALPGLVGRFHDHQERDLVATIAAKAHVLPPGIDLARLDTPEEGGEKDASAAPLLPAESSGTSASPASPVILWNSRWEYDKQPAAFFAALAALAARDIDFRVIVAGEHIDPNAPEFVAAREQLGQRVLWWGYAPDVASYRRLLWQADIVASTAIQEFFGISVLEAMYCGCAPILPHRLSYPELLPETHHAACLYHTPEALVDKLAAAVAHAPAQTGQPFRAIAARYAWQHMAAQYDAVFEQIAAIQPARS